uniref:NR LBD domain-containing protein n=1 Tax=Strongyloides papillosus TaxID=174720 RepID=A0A0N5CAR7_STREA
MSDLWKSNQPFDIVLFEQHDFKNSNKPVYVSKSVYEFGKIELITNSLFLNNVLRTANDGIGEFYMPKTRGFTVNVFDEMCKSLEKEELEVLLMLHRQLCIIAKHLIGDNCPVTPKVINDLEPYAAKILKYPIRLRSRRLLIEMFIVATSYRNNYKNYTIKNDEFVTMLQFNALLYDFGIVKHFNSDRVGGTNCEMIMEIDDFELRLKVTKFLKMFAPDFDITVLPLENEIINKFMGFIEQLVRSFFKTVKCHLNNEHSKLKRFADRLYYINSLFDICFQTMMKLLDGKISDECIIYKCENFHQRLVEIGETAFGFFSDVKFNKAIIINGLDQDMKNFIDKLIKIQIKIFKIPETREQCLMFIKPLYYWKKIVCFIKKIERFPQSSLRNPPRIYARPLVQYFDVIMLLYIQYIDFEEGLENSF